MRATSLTGRRAGRRARPALFGAALLALAATAHGGGMDDAALPVDPCPPGVVTDGTLTGDMLAGFMAIREMSCGEAPRRAFFDRATGEQLTDDEILRRIFNNHTPTVIPLPATAWGLLAGLVGFAWLRKGKPARKPTQAVHRARRRAYEATHARMARELGREWPPTRRG